MSIAYEKDYLEGFCSINEFCSSSKHISLSNSISVIKAAITMIKVLIEDAGLKLTNFFGIQPTPPFADDDIYTDPHDASYFLIDMEKPDKAVLWVVDWERAFELVDVRTKDASSFVVDSDMRTSIRCLAADILCYDANKFTHFETLKSVDAIFDALDSTAQVTLGDLLGLRVFNTKIPAPWSLSTGLTADYLGEDDWAPLERTIIGYDEDIPKAQTKANDKLASLVTSFSDRGHDNVRFYFTIVEQEPTFICVSAPTKTNVSATK
jgi:hypothetical protein